MKKIFLIAVLSFLFNSLFAQTKRKTPNPDEQLKKIDSINKSAIGKPYPDFEYLANNGVVYSKKKLLGKKYYINFWFEGCHPCMEEMDSLVALNNKIKNTNNEFISFTWELPNAVKRIRKERNLNFKIISVSQEECSRLMINGGYPQHIVVDEKGNIEYVRTSRKETNEEIIKKVALILTNKL
jgi:cytochrome c biogenesis protein CcmG, thiol:disulfide interchange protein DsbE